MRSVARNRTIFGVLFFVPLAAVLLVTFACLPAPVGDPEQAKVDAALTGTWQGKSPDNGDMLLVIMRPWDSHTYYMQYLDTAEKDGKQTTHVTHCKAWLTPLGGASFITCELLDEALPGSDDAKPAWAVGRVDLADGSVTFKPTKDDDSPLLKGLDTREKIEAAIKANVDNDELYGKPLTFKKLGKDDQKMVEDALKRATVGD